MRLKIVMMLVLSVPCFVYSAEEGILLKGAHLTSEGFTGRIVGGKDTSIEKHPYQVSLQFIKRNKRYHFCGGAIYNKDWIITAAHCMFTNETNRLRVVSGSTNWRKPEVVSAVAKYIVHQHYNYRSSDKDIALVKLQKPLTFGKKVNKITLPSQGEAVPEGTSVLTTGWGRLQYEDEVLPTRLQKVKLNVVEQSNCKQEYGSMVTPNMICAYLSNMGACNGDSGGPLVRGTQLVGIVSWGSRECGVYPSVYTNVANFVNWIKKHTS